MVLATSKQTTPFDIWWPICRAVVGILAGYFVSQLAFAGLWSICFLLFPDVWNPELAGSEWSPTVTAGCLALSAFIAGFIAAFVASKHPLVIGFVTGILQIPNAAIAMFIIGRTQVGSVFSILVVPLAWLGASLAARMFCAPPRARPYDMRQRNMAC